MFPETQAEIERLKAQVQQSELIIAAHEKKHGQPYLPRHDRVRINPKEVNMQVDEDKIRERAHRLWQEAGKPDGKEEDFWLEAERQLREEQIRHEMKTPDTL